MKDTPAARIQSISWVEHPEENGSQVHMCSKVEDHGLWHMIRRYVNDEGDEVAASHPQSCQVRLVGPGIVIVDARTTGNSDSSLREPTSEVRTSFFPLDMVMIAETIRYLSHLWPRAGQLVAPSVTSPPHSKMTNSSLSIYLQRVVQRLRIWAASLHGVQRNGYEKQSRMRERTMRSSLSSFDLAMAAADQAGYDRVPTK